MYVQAQSLSQMQAVTPRTSAAASARAQPGPAAVPAAPTSDSASSERDASSAINRAAKSLNTNIELSLDERSERPIVRVVDSATGQLIRQIPSEEALELRRALDRITGLLINRTA